MRILMVDDERELAEVIAEFLKRHGHDCRTANSIEEGRQAFKDFQPQAVILDQFLPDGSGMDLIPLFKSAGAWVVCISGAGDPAIGPNALKAGADRFLGKPLNLKALLENLEASHAL